MTPAELVSQLPDSIRVGAHDLSIAVCNLTDEDAAGMFESDKALICVSETPASKTIAVDTLLHEITHALFWAHAIRPGGEEHIVGALASGWTQVYRDNPWLIDWVKEGVQ